MALDLVDTLQSLIRVPSVNPMGRDVVGDIYYESRLTDFLEQTIRRIGIPWERHRVSPQRDNLLARIDGGHKRPVLLLEAHQDTVPIDGMTIDPFAASIKDGRIYGRGACDVKAGIAWILSVASRLAEAQTAHHPTVVVAFSVNEEYGFSGAAHLRRLWKDGHSQLLPSAPDAIIVAEPTELDVVVTHKGIMRWRCHTHGRAAHSSKPHDGKNAIYAMAQVLEAVQQYEQQVVAEINAHPLLGRPTLNVGMIGGGISVNTVPDRCTIEIERRLLPDEDPESAYRQATQFVQQKVDGQMAVEHERPYMASAGLTDQHNAGLARNLSKIAQQLDTSCQHVGVPYGTDACELSADGTPTVVFGPGSLKQAHTADEWIAVSQLEKAAEIAYQFVRNADDVDLSIPPAS